MTTNTTGAPPGAVLWDETVPGGCHWSGVVRRGVALRITDTLGTGNLAMLMFNFEEKSERYNMPDTLKAQHTAYLTKGRVLMTDMGRAMASVIEDTAGWHETVCGVSHDDQLLERFGVRRFQEHRNAMQRSGREGLLKELGRWGLGRRDLHANVNWFTKLVADEDGGLHFDAAHRAPGQFVDLRFDMHTLVIVSAAMHPLDPRAAWSPSAISLAAWRSGLAPANDLCRNARGETRRAFENTERYFAA
jgi:urea carboxylase-associated protein 2